MLFFILNREDFSFVIHLDRQPRTSRRREAQTGSRARSGSRSERTLDAVEHSRTLMEWWPFLIFHRGGLRIKVINNNWYNTQRLLEPIGNVAPVEYEMNYYRFAGRLARDGETQLKQSPENPGRFKLMAATDLTQDQLERLAFIRYLFKLGVQHAQAPGPQSSVAILLFHDAVELFLELASQELDAKPADSFMRYFSRLDEKLRPSPPLPLRENMRRLNDARNALKHRGLRPDRSDLEHYSNIVIRFFEEVTPQIFEVDMDSVSLVTVVRCETVRKYLYAAEAAYRENRAADGSVACAEAFDELLSDYEKRHGDRWGQSPFSSGHYLHDPWFFDEELSRIEKQFKESIEDLNEAVMVLQERMRLLSLGLDYRRYATFRQLIPEVWHVSATPSRRTDKPPNITLEQLQFCIGFVIDTALQLQVAEGNIGHPADGMEQRRNDG